ncbi:uncharacterized protein LOC126552788 [Aphis gossypii]|uniref:uncharacterized protein LOC126552788 n=1 Tax=Aphis gossypii TaxID=80765 RepID=UPI002159464F|nr:uncharacterized protein LOC126552788 [Aphis gossypii]
MGINNIVDEECWDLDDIFLEHNYSDSTVFDCIVYYLAGYIAKRLIRKTKCVQCINGLKNLNTTKFGTLAELVIAKSRGYLTHPDSNLFNILKSLEHSFNKFADELNVFDKTCEDFFKNNVHITFPCVDHRTSMLTDITVYYLVMRMRQYSYIENQNNKKLNKTKKKLSKLVNT